MKYFSGQGRVYGAAIYQQAQGTTPETYLPALRSFQDFGNCSSLILHNGLAAFGHATGGSETPSAAVRSGEMPTFSLTMEELTDNNLAALLQGAVTGIAGATMGSETLVLTAGMSTPLANINLTSFAGITGLTQGTDYTVDLLTGMVNSITATGTYSCGYTYSGYSKISMATTAPPFLCLRFHGMNNADDNAPVVVEIFKTRLYPVNDLPLINESFAQLQVTGRAFRDTSKAVNTTDGQFMRVRKT